MVDDDWEVVDGSAVPSIYEMSTAPRRYREQGPLFRSNSQRDKDEAEERAWYDDDWHDAEGFDESRPTTPRDPGPATARAKERSFFRRSDSQKERDEQAEQVAEEATVDSSDDGSEVSTGGINTQMALMATLTLLSALNVGTEEDTSNPPPTAAETRREKLKERKDAAMRRKREQHSRFSPPKATQQKFAKSRSNKQSAKFSQRR
jgi:hypothetical protein